MSFNIIFLIQNYCLYRNAFIKDEEEHAAIRNETYLATETSRVEKEGGPLSFRASDRTIDLDRSRESDSAKYRQTY
jgi:hypothetical protein